jgi:hypothetical protein
MVQVAGQAWVIGDAAQVGLEANQQKPHQTVAASCTAASSLRSGDVRPITDALALKLWLLRCRIITAAGHSWLSGLCNFWYLESLFARQTAKSDNMHLQIVMDSNGDTRHEFDPKDLSSLATAEARFQELTGKGFRAVALGKDGAPGELMRTFDPRAAQTLFMPQLQGG